MPRAGRMSGIARARCPRTVCATPRSSRFLLVVPAQTAHDQRASYGRIDLVDAVCTLQFKSHTRATAGLVVPKYCNGGNVGTVGHVAGEHGHGRLKHRYVGGVLLFGFGDCLGYLATGSCKRRG
jgi:hypothetical protein